MYEWLTSFHLNPRQLTEDEREANEVTNTIDENGEEQITEAWTADDSFYHHSNPLTEDDYGNMVSCIVRSKYSADAVEAIQLNYLNEQTAEHIAEMNALQRWREEAKQAARGAINNVTQE